MINKTTVLLIQKDVKTVSDLTEKCLEAGICEKNIFAVSDAESAERYLEIAGISYIIIDADMYNYLMASIIEKFSEYFPIHTIITNAKPEQKTLRMMNDKSLTFIGSFDELLDIIQDNSRIIPYPYSEISNYRNI